MVMGCLFVVSAMDGIVNKLPCAAVIGVLLVRRDWVPAYAGTGTLYSLEHANKAPVPAKAGT